MSWLLDEYRTRISIRDASRFSTAEYFIDELVRWTEASICYILPMTFMRAWHAEMSNDFREALSRRATRESIYYD